MCLENRHHHVASNTWERPGSDSSDTWGEPNIRSCLGQFFKWFTELAEEFRMGTQMQSVCLWCIPFGLCLFHHLDGLWSPRLFSVGCEVYMSWNTPSLVSKLQSCPETPMCLSIIWNVCVPVTFYNQNVLLWCLFYLRLEFAVKIIHFTAAINEPSHDKTNKMACAPSEDSDQLGHLPSLIRVFAVRSVGS